MNYLALLGGIIGLVAFLLLIINLRRSNVEQSFAAFLLWALLDVIATTTTIIQGGNYWLALSNAIGSIAITIILISKRQVLWTWIESMTTVLVIICLIVWYTSGEVAGIVASSLANLIAAIPQMVDTYKRPESTPSLPYGVFFIGNVLSLLAGGSWAIEERFYQSTSIVLTLVILLLSLRRRVA
ncbi:MAG: hypothetical protein WDO15_21825 [Bacteroidota bacterium]